MVFTRANRSLICCTSIISTHDQARQRGHHGLLLPAASHQQQIQHRHQDTDGRYFENQVNIHCLSLTEVK